MNPFEPFIDEQVVNTVTADDQSRSQIIQLSDGRILVVWESDNDTGAGGAAGVDLIGQIFDQLGNAVGGEFRVNDGRFADDEQDVSLAATDDGGFIAVFLDQESGTDQSVALSQFDDQGALVRNATIADDEPNSDFVDPVIAVTSATSALIVYVEENADGNDLVAKTYNPTTGAVGAEIAIVTSTTTNYDNPAITVKDNGNYLVAYTADLTSGDSNIIMREIDVNTGAVVDSSFVAISSNLVEDSASLAVLDNGNTVVTWRTAEDTGNGSQEFQIRYQVFDATTNDAITPDVIVETVTKPNGFSLNNLTAPVVTQLDGGGWTISYSKSTGSFLGADSDIITVQYDSSGNEVGTRLETSGSGSQSVPAQLTTADGRVFLTYTETNNSNQDIVLEVLDGRTGPTQGIGAVIGTQGDDTVSEFIAPSAGDFFLLGGNDSLSVSNVAVGETFDGGDGFDTLFAATNADVVVNLVSNTFTSPASNGDNDTVLNFEEVIGGGGDDTLTGGTTSGYINQNTGVVVENGYFLRGRAGNDTITSNGQGNYEGGAGADVLTSSTSNVFSFLSYEGSDAAVSVNLDSQTAAGGHATGDVLTGWLSVIGSDFNDVLTGGSSSNWLEGGAGADTLNGGGGTDYASYINADAGVRVDLSGTRAGTGDAAGDTFNSIEGIYGSTFSDQLYSDGNLATNLRGLDGDDFFFASGQANINGGNGYDRLTARDGANQAFDIFLSNSTLELVRGTNLDDVLDASGVVAESLVDQNGNTQPVRLFGNNGDDTLTGSDFFDFISGGNGNDTIVGNGGNDILDGLRGADNVSGGDGNDIIFVDDEDTLDGGAGYDQIFVRGYAADNAYDLRFNDIEFANGNSADDNFDAQGVTYSVKFFGQGGDDDLNGGEGNDELFGGPGDDFLNGRGGNDILNGAAGRNAFNGGAGDDIILTDNASLIAINGRAVAQVVGGAGFDRLYLQTDSGVATQPIYDLTYGQIEFAFGNTADNIFDATNASFAVKLQGVGGDDTLIGGFGADQIFGGDGEDTLQGNQGNDTLYGGSGADTFVYDAAGFGDDFIVGFEDGTDIIDMSGLGIDFNDLTLTRVSGLTTLVEFGGDSILINGINIDDLDAADFIF